MLMGRPQDAWRDLLSTFPPGRVLVVSNSAGSLKDPYGVEVGSASRKQICNSLMNLNRQSYYHTPSTHRSFSMPDPNRDARQISWLTFEAF